MLFPTVEFAIFFPIVLVLSWALMSRQPLWKPFIVVASYVFYAAADPRFCLLLAAITLVSQLAAVAIHRTQDERLRNWFTAGGVVFDLGILAGVTRATVMALARRTPEASSATRRP